MEHEPWHTQMYTSSVVSSLLCLDLCQACLLVDAENIARRVVKEGIDLALIRVDRLHDLAACGDDGLDRCRGTGDHDVHQQPWISGWRASKDPRAAHFVGRVVESGRAIVALPNVPAEDLLVELSGLRDVDGRDFEVANLARSVVGGWCWDGHSSSPLSCSIGSIGVSYFILSKYRPSVLKKQETGGIS